MFISSNQKERDSATAYRTSLYSPCEVKYTRFKVFADAAGTFLSGMMVEVLGTVLGTAIQGQIVGGVSSCPAELNNTNSSNSTVHTARGSLEETVRPSTHSLPPNTNAYKFLSV